MAVDLLHALLATFLVPRHHLDELARLLLVVGGLLGVHLDFVGFELDVVNLQAHE